MSDEQWRDTTSYRQGQRGTIEPLEWSCSTPGLRVSLYRMHEGHGRYSDDWYASVLGRGCEISQVRCSPDIEAAKVRAFELVDEHIAEIASAVASLRVVNHRNTLASK